MSSRTGRPAYNREHLMTLLEQCSRRGRRLVRLNERTAAQTLGWHRTTVKRALDDLENEGRIRRFKRLGHQGLVVQLLSN
jgi:predicted ArsR family transcriptional regulator